MWGEYTVKRKKKLFIIFLVPVIVIVIVQGIVPLLTVVFSGIKSDMAENVIDLDNHTVENRQVVLENDMVEHWRSVYKEEDFLNSNLAALIIDVCRKLIVEVPVFVRAGADQLLVWIPGEKTEKVLGVADELRREIGNLTNDNYLELNFRAGLSYAANRDIKANEIFDQVRIALTAAKNSGHGDMVYQELPPDNLAYIEPARLCSIDSVDRLDQMSLSSIALNLFDRGSEVRLNQVLVNLLSNAAKYSNAGGHVKLTVRETEVDDGSSDIYFEVRDDGIGIPENKQQLIFQRFEQADDSASARKQGTGLGLAISNRLVHMMNSDIKLESQPGVG